MMQYCNNKEILHHVGRSWKEGNLVTLWSALPSPTQSLKRPSIDRVSAGCPYQSWGFLWWWGWHLSGESWLGGIIHTDFSTSAAWKGLRSDDWQSANSYQRLPSSGARALINVIVKLDPHNIWKPPCWNLPQPFSPILYNKYFPLLYFSLHCIGALVNLAII